MGALSLVEALASVPDPRKPKGRRHPLRAILSLSVVAILAGCKSLEAIARSGRDHGTPLAHALGFARGKTPAKSTFSEVFRALDLDAFEAAIGRWLSAREQGADWEAVAIDGKTLRGSVDGLVPAVHLLTAFIPSAALAIKQLRVDAKTNEHKAALRFLGALPIKGKVASFDATFAHRDAAQEVLDAGGDYLFTVKDNRPESKKQIQAALDDDVAFPPLPT